MGALTPEVVVGAAENQFLRRTHLVILPPTTGQNLDALRAVFALVCPRPPLQSLTREMEWGSQSVGVERKRQTCTGTPQVRRPHSVAMPPGSAGLNVRKTARYAGKDRDPLQLVLLQNPIDGPSGANVSAFIQQSGLDGGR